MKAILYGRFSPRPQAATCESIETQLRDLREYAAKQGYAIAGEFSDPEMSGDDEERPGLWQAMEALKKGYVLLAWKSDRLARSVYLSEFLHREAANKGARIEFLHSRNGESADDILVRQIIAAVDEHAKKVNAVRTRLAMLSQQAAGKVVSRFAPFGKKIVGGRLVDDPGEQAAIARIRELHAQGHGRVMIQRKLKEAAKKRIRELSAEGVDSQAMRLALRREGIRGRSREWPRSTLSKIIARFSAEHRSP